MQQVYTQFEKNSNRYTLIDVATEKRWANEFFKTKYEAKQFARQNGLAIVPKPVEDLFDDLFQVPFQVRKAIKKHSEMEADYILCEKLLEELKPYGYTFEYGLDAIPYNLKKA